MLMFLRLHMLMILTLRMCSMLSAGVEWYNSSSPVAARPLEMTTSQEEVKREDDEILMQL